VYVPEYGVKGAVYFRDSDGSICIPPDPFPSETDAIVDDFSSDEGLQIITLKVLKNGKEKAVVVSLFDHLSVSVSVHSPSPHLPSLKFSLVRFGLDDKLCKNEKINIIREMKKREGDKNMEMGFAAAKLASKLEKLTKMKRAPEEEKNFKLFSQSDNLYSVCASVRGLSLENGFHNSKPSSEICETRKSDPEISDAEMQGKYKSSEGRQNAQSKKGSANLIRRWRVADLTKRRDW